MWAFFHCEDKVKFYHKLTSDSFNRMMLSQNSVHKIVICVNIAK